MWKQIKPESILMALAVVLAAYLLKCGIETFAQKDQAVSVRGLATREVEADNVVWPIRIKITGSDMQGISKRIAADMQKTTAWLTEKGIDAKEIETGATELTDRWANEYASNYGGERYLMIGTLVVNSGDVKKVRELVSHVNKLTAQGVAVAASDWNTGITYNFRSLNDIKPAMIEEANKNARTAAEKFAADSGCRIGKLKSATQGLFEISDRDAYTPYIKEVRVVTNAQFQLKN